MVITPLLKLRDFERSFEIHTNASDISIGVGLMYDGHLVAYESEKLQEK